MIWLFSIVSHHVQKLKYYWPMTTMQVCTHQGRFSHNLRLQANLHHLRGQRDGMLPLSSIYTCCHGRTPMKLKRADSICRS
eukprot:Skav224647  [mRNA]  locus=scaffold4300:60079:61348:- [translate_table: standard]